MAAKPFAVCILSGKRKSGKDYVAERLKILLGKSNCEILRLSGPLKREYARIHKLDYQKLLDSSDYKEKYRKDMIKWGEEKRNAEPYYFCELAAKMAYRDAQSETKLYWLVSDARRITDLQFFQQHYPRVVHVRVTASDDVRMRRGWMFTNGVDDAESECGLDDVIFDVAIINNGDNEQLENSLASLKDKLTA
ncbi:predicted protein [Nematostella vectensis]|uniref:Phosphomevalonate kinase n=1 Tax=Nematostella vectensis TaxID=45351 RepID=A7RZW5_NEMVE|nr:predicted protein [Nematostella vectensis]|eukprot:XP_001635081.1 predicted protein [Nematostella vectensis]